MSSMPTATPTSPEPVISLAGAQDSSGVRTSLHSALAAALLLPVLVLAHELAHFLLGVLLGFTGGELFYNGAFVGIAPEGASPLVQALPKAAGQFASLLIALSAAALVPRFGAHPALLALIFAEASRALLMFGVFLARGFAGGWHPSGFDEISRLVNPMRPSGLGGLMVDSLAVALPTLALIYALRTLAPLPRRWALLGIIVGTAVGYAWYFGIAGPLLLPRPS